MVGLLIFKKFRKQTINTPYSIYTRGAVGATEILTNIRRRARGNTVGATEILTNIRRRGRGNTVGATGILTNDMKVGKNFHSQKQNKITQ